MPFDPIRDFGNMLEASKLQQALRELNPDINFDMAGRLGLAQPRLDELQGVFWSGRHITSMDRGPMIPEFDVWGVFKGRKTHIVKMGWRTTLEKIVRKQVPGITWHKLCKKLGVDYKRFVGDPETLEVA